LSSDAAVCQVRAAQWLRACAVLLIGLLPLGLMLICASSSAAQPRPVPPVISPDGATFLPRLDFSFAWASLLTTDRRFDWRGQVDFDLDIVDYGSGRVAFTSRYEGILGRERRRYDLNQGHYFFEASGSLRVKGTEVVMLSQHVSRHAVDRENGPAISWNTLGARAQRAWGRSSKPGWAGTRVDGAIELSRPMQQAFVDYRWLSRARASMRRPISPKLAIIVDARGEVAGVNAETRGRTRVCGGRIEGALRFAGRAAALELFAGYERRIDAYPTDRFRVRWFTLGFRITSL
jgi:hypothetical protein